MSKLSSLESKESSPRMPVRIRKSSTRTPPTLLTVLREKLVLLLMLREKPRRLREHRLELPRRRR